MKFLCDENFKKRLVKSLLVLGHDAVTSRIGASDDAIYERALKESRIILSNDTDFLDTAKFPLARTPGRVVFRTFPATFALQYERMEALLAEFPSPRDFKGLLIELETGAIVSRDK